MTFFLILIICLFSDLFSMFTKPRFKLGIDTPQGSLNEAREEYFLSKFVNRKTLGENLFELERKKRLLQKKQSKKYLMRSLVEENFGYFVNFPKTTLEKDLQKKMLDSVLDDLLLTGILPSERKNIFIVHVKTQLLLTYFIVMNIYWDGDPYGYFINSVTHDVDYEFFLEKIKYDFKNNINRLKNYEKNKKIDIKKIEDYIDCYDYPIPRILFLLDLFECITNNINARKINLSLDEFFSCYIYILYNINIILRTSGADVVLQKQDSDHKLLNNLHVSMNCSYKESVDNIKKMENASGIGCHLLRINIYFLVHLIEILKFRQYDNKFNINWKHMVDFNRDKLSIDVDSLDIVSTYVVLRYPQPFCVIYRNIFLWQFSN